MTQQLPQPGDVWERDGDWRGIESVTGGTVVYGSYDGQCQETLSQWQAWALGAILIERDGKKVEVNDGE